VRAKNSHFFDVILTAIVEKVTDTGVTSVIPWMGMKMRDRLLDYFFNRQDKYSSGI
jgi:hypothetical protein